MTTCSPGRGARRARVWMLALWMCSSLGRGAWAATADVADAPPSEGSALDVAPECWSLHGQLTGVVQYHPRFTSPYQGANSLDPRNEVKETADLTLYAGVRLWKGAEVYVNPEVDQGFGLSDTLGVAGYPSGEAYKVGQNAPYLRLPRFFLRQVIELGGGSETVEPAANQLGGTRSVDRITLTVGKFSVVDVFDTSRYAHDPRADFLDWAIIDSGAFDYAADAWGYTYGAALDWAQSWWSVRGGLFDLSEVPNSKHLDGSFEQFAAIGELEARHELLGRPGRVALLGFINRGRMATYDDAVRLGEETGSTPDVSLVRHSRSRPGGALTVEQELASGLGAFVRASLNDGRKEAFEFTEINRSVAAGVSLHGSLWGRPRDTFGLAGVVNAISGDARRYFAAGGLGILIGDGRLPHYGVEAIVETYYSLRVAEHLSVGLDYEYVVNPAYNRDRGAVSVFGLRVHAEM